VDGILWTIRVTVQEGEKGRARQATPLTWTGGAGVPVSLGLSKLLGLSTFNLLSELSPPAIRNPPYSTMASKRKVTDSDSAMHVKRKALKITNANNNILLDAYPLFNFTQLFNKKSPPCCLSTLRYHQWTPLATSSTFLLNCKLRSMHMSLPDLPAWPSR
jgi:hypothetical protein